MLLSEFVKTYDLKGNIIFDYEINKVTDDSRNINKDDVFIIIKGINNSGFDYLNDVFNKGVRTIIINDDTNRELIYSNINVFKVKDTKEWYLNYLLTINNQLLNKIKIIGITGTNGKTTSSFLVYTILKKYKNVMLVGTNGSYVYVNKKEFCYDTKNTTPKLSVILDIINNHPNIKYLILEVSSDAVESRRLGNLKFDIIGLTNIGHDHVNTHKSYENYINSKINLFKSLKNSKNSFAVINEDDKYFNRFKKTINKENKIFSYGINNGDLRGEIISMNQNYMMINVVDKEHDMTFGTNLLGRFNVYNILLSIKMLELLGIPFIKIIDSFSHNIEIPGRYNKYRIKERNIYIDYAHNPEAIKEFLCMINKITDNKIITVVGAGGCRDKLKRGKMGLYSENYSDKVIFTEDTSREEDVKEIIKGLTSEITENNYLIEYDRPAAIKKAFEISEPNDFIILLGMGNDRYGVNNKLTDLDIIKQIGK